MEQVIGAVEQDVRRRPCPCCNTSLAEAHVVVHQVRPRTLRVGWVCPSCGCAHCGIIEVRPELLAAVAAEEPIELPSGWAADGFLY